MSENYYELLELNRSCTQEDIANAYKRLALKYHPKKSSDKEKAIYEYQFNQVAEAYEVLSDRKQNNFKSQRIKEEYTIFTDSKD